MAREGRPCEQRLRRGGERWGGGTAAVWAECLVGGGSLGARQPWRRCWGGCWEEEGGESGEGHGQVVMGKAGGKVSYDEPTLGVTLCSLFSFRRVRLLHGWLVWCG